MILMRLIIKSLLIVIGSLIICLSILQPTQGQYTADGQSFILVSPISISSPVNTTYVTNQVFLNVTIRSLLKDANVVLTYSIDGKENATLPISEGLVPVWADVTYVNGTKTKEISSTLSYYAISGFIELEDLQQGQHSLTVYAQYDVPSMQKTAFDNKTVHFTVNDEELPIVTDEDTPKYVFTNTIIYASVGIFSLIAIFCYVLVTKLKQRNGRT